MNQAHQQTSTNGAGTCNTSVKALGSFDPTTPESYAMVLDAVRLLSQCADQLDAFFLRRLINVRNNLRGLGWQGEHMGDLSKDGFTLYKNIFHAGAGRNVVGVEYVILGGPAGRITVTDNLHQDELDLAKFIDLCAVNEADKVARPLQRMAVVRHSAQCFVG